MKFKTLLTLAMFTSASVSASNGYYRFPDLNEDKLVFTAEGDIWVAKTDKSQARRLTTHTAEERQGTISPDGKQVAYIADYEGSQDVYVIPIDGGLAKRVSFENGRAMVHGWTPDGAVIYSTNSRVGIPRSWTLKTVYPDSLQSQNIEVADAREGVMDEDGRFVYFSQFGVADRFDNARVYRGGAIGELWRFEHGSNKEAQLLTGKHEGNAREPMVYKNHLYFISDASGSDNIWKMKLDGSDIKQVTRYTEWPIRSANLHKGKIVYQLGADIKMLNLRRGKSKTLDIELTSDFPNLRERWVNEPLNYTTWVSFTGELEKVAITARGRVAIAGIDKSRLVEINTPIDSRTKNAVLDPDGKWVYAFNDASGEQEIWRFAADGSAQAEQLTKDGSVVRLGLQLSPDGKHIVHSDKKGGVWLLSVDSGENKKILQAGDGASIDNDIGFSADSKLIAVSVRSKGKPRYRIALYSIDEDKHQFLTTSKYTSYSPAFSPDGKWLYFLSERNFTATPGHPWGDRNLGSMVDRQAMIFAYSLDADAKFPFQAPNELMVDDKAEKSKEDEEQPLVDWDGIESRLWQVKVPAGNYWNLSVNKKYLYVQDRVTEPGALSVIKSIEIGPLAKMETYSFNAVGYQLADDGKQLLVQKGRRSSAKYYMVPAKAKMPKDLKNQMVRTRDWNMLLDPRLEWQQLFHDAWLQHRDGLFDKNLKGVDWAKVKSKYQPLLSRLTDRRELNDVLAQMVGELNTLHSQIRSGDVPTPENRASQANLGAELEQSVDGVKIGLIYQHDPEMPWRAPPLNQPGVNAQVGDIILGINGKKVKSISELVAALRNQVGKQVLLELKRGDEAHKTIVVPTNSFTDERQRYKHWVNQNSDKVETADENLGYMHLWTMGGAELGNFTEAFYANHQKQGLIIDVRRNRGGNIDSIVIEKLLRKAWSYWQFSDNNNVTNMQQAFRGHLVVLADQGTYSDGETFSAAIKALKLGPVIGKRTAGAGVFLSDGNWLSDNGMARMAEIAQFSMDGRWIIEGHGVGPTIEVDNLPHAFYKGHDAQLEKAIEYLKQKIKDEPIKPLEAKPYPANGIPAEDI